MQKLGGGEEAGVCADLARGQALGRVAQSALGELGGKLADVGGMEDVHGVRVLVERSNGGRGTDGGDSAVHIVRLCGEQ